MSSITIYTGVEFAEHTKTRRVSFTVPFDAEPDPEMIYRAANRIDEAEADAASLPEAYRPIRYGIDTAGMPSMSAGDRFEIRSDSGRLVGRWHCEPVGWSVDTIEEGAA